MKRENNKRLQERIGYLEMAARDTLRKASECMGDGGSAPDVESAATFARAAQVFAEMAAELQLQLKAARS